MAADPAADLFGAVPQADAQRQLRFSKRLPVQRCRRILERCLDLTPGEVAHRLLRLVARRPPREHVSAASLVPSPSGISSALDRRFVVGPRDRDRIVETLAADAMQRARIIEEAHGLVRAGVRIFDRVISLDPHALDWQADPSTGRRLWSDACRTEGDAVAATRTADGRILTDVKYVWELSRQQFLLPLALAGHLESDPVLIDRTLALVDGWITQNPAGRGVNWSSVLEVGVRAISWLWTLPFVLECRELDDRRRDAWLASLGEHYDFLRRNLSIYTDRSNHLIGEATALWLLASVLPDLPDAAVEAGRALDVLAIEIERQVTGDGVSCEQAVGYHCFVLDFYLQVVSVARRIETPLPPIIESRVAAMLAFLDRLLGVGGALPSIGDADDGSGVPMAAALAPRERAAALLALGARLFERSSTADRAVPHPFTWDVLSDATPGSPPPGLERDQSVLLREGGYCFLEARTSGGDHRQLVFDVGKLGYLPNAAHEHADALSVLVRVNDTLVLADPGTGTYTASPSIRNGFRATACHNTITVDGLDQADVLDTFKWLNLTRTEVVAWESDDLFDWVEARHLGYCRLREPVVHRRAVLFVRPEYWIVVDRLEGRGTHRIRRRFHVPPEVRLSAVGPETYEARSEATGDGVRLTFVDPPTPTPLVSSIETGPWSTGYGRWETSARLSSEAAVTLGATFLTLITPVVARQSLCDVDRAPLGSAGANEIVLCRTRTRHAEGEDALMIRHGDGRGSNAPHDLVFVRGSGSNRVERQLAELDRRLEPSHP